MEISLPSDCGNSPRIAIVSDFLASWAKGDVAAVAEWLAEDVVWAVVGEGLYRGPESAQATTPRINVERLEVRSVVTHGRLASCDGSLEAGNTRVHFSHALRFASTSKTAKLAELRSYLVTTQAH